LTKYLFCINCNGYTFT